jgi:C1A family cysteine protease
MVKANDPIDRILEEAGLRSVSKHSKTLSKYNIDNVLQLHGALNPQLPRLDKKTIKQKGLTQAYISIEKSARANENGQAKTIKRLLGISDTQARKVLDILNKTNFPSRSYKINRSELSLGLSVGRKSSKHRMVKIAPPLDSFSSSHIINNYSRMGPVFDQGQRGTCTANATCAMVDYLTGKRTSRQFLYHQCKMIDGVPTEEGTHIESAIQLLVNDRLIDYGTAMESAWRYDPNPKSGSEHHGPPPEACFNGERAFGLHPVGFEYGKVRSSTIIDDIKSILMGFSGYGASPVVVGLRIFRSFNNTNSRDTGWITMPLPGEESLWVGGHAMLVVGWFEENTPYGKKGLFLVRNSWGSSWAQRNTMGYPGHALIPYQYFQKYCFNALAVMDSSCSKTQINPGDRLYNRYTSTKIQRHWKAARKSSKPYDGPVDLLKKVFIGDFIRD